MADLLTFARDRRADIARQIDELDEFIRMARHLAETAGQPVAVPPASGSGDGPGTRASSAPRLIEAPAEEEPEDAIAVEAASDSAAMEESGTEEDRATRNLLANAPWKGVTPKTRSAGTGDPFAPTRFNLLRRAPAPG